MDCDQLCPQVLDDHWVFRGYYLSSPGFLFMISGQLKVKGQIALQYFFKRKGNAHVEANSPSAIEVAAFFDENLKTEPKLNCSTVQTLNNAITFCVCDFRLPPQYKLDHRCSGMLHGVDWWVVTDVLGQPITCKNYHSALRNILKERRSAFFMLYPRKNVAN